MVYSIQFEKLFVLGKRRWIYFGGLVAITYFFCQSLMLPYGNALRSLLPNRFPEKDILLSANSYHSSESLPGSLNRNNAEKYNVGGISEFNSTLEGERLDNDLEFVEDPNIDDEFLEQNANVNEVVDMTKSDIQENTNFVKNPKVLLSTDSSDPSLDKPSIIEKIEEPKRDDNHLILPSDFSGLVNSSEVTMNQPVKKKMRCDMPPKTVTTFYQMNRLLVRHRRSARAKKPAWVSAQDREIVSARLQIENAVIGKNDGELYSPLFRNVSTFKRSYELMEKILKVYVYKDGNKPIFHVPELKGIYASEGWFMKLMEGNKRFTVKDPKKAHLFYMPFGSRLLQHNLYVPNSHNRTNLRDYMKNYAEKIAAKYPFWNRTGGADHFLVACHDWAPYETRHHMETCIKSLCNADVTLGFKIGRDVSLPETYVRSARDPQRDLGGNPPSNRKILAFYAGNMHGYLRQILLKQWKDKDSDMKILGPMPPGVASKMTYIQHMKTSKYCICPKGYEVNSPRVVESIFYECVPVIISDNFIPPFFEILNWESFSVIVAEKDIVNLKEILSSISQEKYLQMQLGVRKIQKHFLWHAKPVKYDLFHMVLHSIWYNRVFQIKTR